MRALPAPRRQDPGHLRLRGRPAGPPAHGAHLHPAQRRHRPRRGCIRPDLIEHVIRPVVPAEFADDDYEVYVNPTGRFVIGGPRRRHRPHRPQDHRRHLRRHGPPRRRRLLRQGPVQGRPLGRLRRPLGGQERRRRRRRQPLRGPGGLRHRRGPAGVDHGRDVRHRDGRPRPGSTRPSTQVFDLRPAAIIRDLDLRRPIYRSTAAYGHFGRQPRRRVHLGADRPARRVQVGPRASDRPVPTARPPPAAPGPPSRRPSPSRRRPDRSGRRGPAGRAVVRVLPDQPAIDKAFDYLVPEALGDQVRVGTMVRIALHGRRVGGWVVADDVEPPPGVTLRPLAKVTGWGPPADVIDLAGWAAWRWAGPAGAFLRTASPGTPCGPLPRPARPPAAGPPCPTDELVAEAFGRRAGRAAPAAGRRPLRRGPGRRGAGPRAGPGAVRQRAPGTWACGCGGPGSGGRHAPATGPRPGPGRWWSGSRAGGVGAGGATWPRWWCSTSTTRPGSRSRRRPGTPATSPPSGPGGPGCPCVLVSPVPSLEALALGSAGGAVAGRRAGRLAGGRGGRPARRRPRAQRPVLRAAGDRPAPGRAGGVRAQPHGPGPAAGLRRLRRDRPLRALRGGRGADRRPPASSAAAARTARPPSLPGLRRHRASRTCGPA